MKTYAIKPLKWKKVRDHWEAKGLCSVYLILKGATYIRDARYILRIIAGGDLFQSDHASARLAKEAAERFYAEHVRAYLQEVE